MSENNLRIGNYNSNCRMRVFRIQEWNALMMANMIRIDLMRSMVCTIYTAKSHDLHMLRVNIEEIASGFRYSKDIAFKSLKMASSLASVPV